MFMFSSFSPENIVYTICFTPSSGTTHNIDQVPPHDLRCQRKKMLSVLPVPVPCVQELKISLADEFCSLQRQISPLPFHQIVSQPSQVGLDDFKQLIFRFGIAVSPLMQEHRDFARLIGLRSHK